jgi:apolipoprotein N-acyltransferase
VLFSNYLKLAIFSGILLVLGFPKFNLSILSWFALVPILFAIRNSDLKESFRLGFVTGVVYFGGIMNWLLILSPFSTVFWVTLGYVFLSAYLACYVFLWTVSISFISQHWLKKLDTGSIAYKLAYIFLIALSWTGLEVLRGYVITGLPWASLAYTQWANIPVIQIASIVGMYGVTFLVVLVNGVIAISINDIRSWKSSLKSAIIPAGILIICLIYGFIVPNNSLEGKKIKIAMVPGNIKQKDKMSSWGDKSGWIFDKYIDTTYKIIDEKPDLIVWPETAVPQIMFPESAEYERIKSLLSRWKTHFLLGAISYELTNPGWKIYNSAFLLKPNGDIIDKYDKIHLVPISESFPFKKYLPEKIKAMVVGVSDFDRGNRYTVFSSPLANIGIPICFESVFPQISRKFVNDGANLIGIITNDSWFIGTFAAEQHFSMAPFRAVENRTSVFHCANYGISGIIDPYGRITQRLDPEKNEDGYIVGDVGIYQAGTFYTKHGDYLPWTCLAVLLFFIVQTWWFDYRKHKKKQGDSDANRDTLRHSGNKRKSDGGRRASLTSPTKKKKQKN